MDLWDMAGTRGAVRSGHVLQQSRALSPKFPPAHGLYKTVHESDRTIVALRMRSLTVLLHLSFGSSPYGGLPFDYHHYSRVSQEVLSYFNGEIVFLSVV